jgi:hypothetical protein
MKIVVIFGLIALSVTKKENKIVVIKIIKLPLMN